MTGNLKEMLEMYEARGESNFLAAKELSERADRCRTQYSYCMRIVESLTETIAALEKLKEISNDY